jgi:hypothetical protein
MSFNLSFRIVHRGRRPLFAGAPFIFVTAV